MLRHIDSIKRTVGSAVSHNYVLMAKCSFLLSVLRTNIQFPNKESYRIQIWIWMAFTSKFKLHVPSLLSAAHALLVVCRGNIIMVGEGWDCCIYNSVF